MPEDTDLMSEANSKPHWILPAIPLVLGYVVLACREINLSVVDLGRHLQNGRWFFSDWKDWKVLSTNFYSYTFPDFPFANHHWGTGVLFYFLQEAFGFEGLTVFFVGLSATALLLMYRHTARRLGTLLGLGCTLIVLPLLLSRTEIRPEVFSVFFSAVFFSILANGTQDSQGRPRKVLFLLSLPLLMMAWVNLHVCFVFGFFLIGSFLFEGVLQYFKTRSQSEKSKLLLLSQSLLLCLGATLVNPIGIKLVLTPFQGFIDYGYRIVENQSVYFLWNLHFYGQVLPFLILIPPLIGGLLYSHFKTKAPLGVAVTLIASTFLFLGGLAIRNFPFLGLFFIPYLATLFRNPASEDPSKNKLAPIVLILFGLASNLSYFGYFWSAEGVPFGIGLKNKIADSAQFFLDHDIKGPIFNNYDIGGYLIYYLFPRHKVFVDNRPEAYPSSFLKDVYVPMQENEERWKQEEAKYEFNVIYFGWHDYTPAAQTFLTRRIRDPRWVPVYADAYALILVRNTENNRAVIDRFKVPAEAFRVIPSGD